MGIVDSAMAGLRSALAGGDTDDDSTDQVARKLRGIMPNPDIMSRFGMGSGQPGSNAISSPARSAPSNASDNTYAPGTAPATPAAATPGFGKAMNPPTYTAPDPAQRAALVQKRDALARPLNPNDPQYKPSFGRKLAGIGAAFGIGFAGKPQVGMEVGGDIIRSKYNQAEKVRTADYASAEKDLSDYDTSRSQTLADFKAQHESFQDTLEANKPGTQLFGDEQNNPYYMTPSGRKIPAYNKKEDAAPLGPPTTIESGAAREIAAGTPDGPFNKKLDKERKFSKPDRQPTELETWIAAFRRDNGREPTADEIAQRKAKTRGTPTDFSKVELEKKKALLAAEDRYNKDVEDGNPNAEKRLNQAKQLAQETYLQQIRELGGSVAGDQPESAPAGKTVPGKTVPGKTGQQAAQNKTPVQALKGHKVGDVVTLKGGKRVKIKQLYSDGTFEHEPAS